MDERTADKIIEATRWPRMMATTMLAMLAIFLLAETVKVLKESRFVGSGVAATNTITVSGEGHVFAVPDTATFSVTIQETAKDVRSAQDAATKKSNDIIAYLKSQSIDEKDIQTIDYNVNPEYSYGDTRCACPPGGVCPPCPPVGKPTITGYQVSQTLSVKVRDPKKAGDLLTGVGSRGASYVSGLSFTIDDQTKLEADARGKAIADAREKAEALAKQLGVSLVRVVGFSENGIQPIYYAKAMAADSMGRGGAPIPAPAPEIPTGQNKITSNVNVTYEIR